MTTMNVLIVEDESIVAMEIESYVKKLGYHVVDICSNAEDALAVARDERIDIALMDICIKGDLDGVETAELIKKAYPRTEIIFLTAHTDDYNVDRAITLDPVAYLSKPFNREELRIFLKIATQKVQGKTFNKKDIPHHIYLDEEFCYDTRNTMLFCCEEPLRLTKKESALMDILIANKNKVVATYTIENTLWPEKDTTPNTLRTLVRRLREKLKYRFVKTVNGQGYILTINQ
ncbi:hypothetical protein YH65_06675 [Sulfurovum lithotrophicum]|uniref:DNA-binding response regulator n=1 Tax=Sulfurovum lithotrophicum TaxID=206403 RepID=A0A7U4M1F6_9BACT|nr:response regulator [Sulfurovum lithotrophicum]AKF25111.1 hypothetical protein YH65_06675 [Sulfurovum lithotrophicum]